MDMVCSIPKVFQTAAQRSFTVVVAGNKGEKTSYDMYLSLCYAMFMDQQMFKVIVDHRMFMKVLLLNGCDGEGRTHVNP